MHILVVDFETSGLDPDINAPMAFGWVLLNDQLEEVRYGENLIRPFENAIIDPKAIEVNKLDRELCGQYGISELDVLDILEHQINEYTRAEEEPKQKRLKTLWAGQNPSFDFGFYKAMLRRANRLAPIMLDYHLLDTFSLGVGQLFNKSMSQIYSDCRLEGLVKKSGGLLRTPHQALADAMASAEVIRRCLLRFWDFSGDPFRIIKAKHEEDETIIDESGRRRVRHSD